MKACNLICAALVMVASAGCAARLRREIDELEREATYLEDRVNQLQYSNQECRESLESSQRENESLLRGVPADSRRDTGKPRRGTGVDLSPPVVEVPGFEGPPEIQPFDPNVPEGVRGRDVQANEADDPDDSTSDDDARKPAAGVGPKLKPRGFDNPSDEPPPLFKEKTADAAPGGAADPGDGDEIVRRITLNRSLTGGHDIDGRPGDEGVMVVIEPLDAEGELIEVAGDVSVTLLDPAQKGNAAQVAQWEFTATEAAKYLKRTPMGDGLHFTMRWPHSPPVNHALDLYVKYTTPDGRELRAEKQIEVDPPQGASAAKSWTRSHARPSESIADEAENANEKLPRGRAKAVRPLEKNEGDDDPSDAPQTTRQGSVRTSRGPVWTPYR
jgi:hypothetical protein